MDCALTSIFTKGNDRKLEEVKLGRKKRILDEKKKKRKEIPDSRDGSCIIFFIACLHCTYLVLCALKGGDLVWLLLLLLQGYL